MQTKKHIYSFEVAKQEEKTYTEKIIQNKPYVLWGDGTGLLKNNYPEYLTYLYHNSSTHSGFINNKLNYVNGAGFLIDETKIVNPNQTEQINNIINNANNEETLFDVASQTNLDYLIFGGFAVELLFNDYTNKVASINYIEFDKLRVDVEENLYYYSEDWSKHIPKYQTIKGYDKNDLTGKRILYFKDKSKGSKHYPKPDYFSGIKDIESDIEITNYNYTSLLSNFSPNVVINVNGADGMSDDEKDNFYQNVKKNYVGTNKEKVIISFNEGFDKRTSIEKLGDDNSHLKFLETQKSVNQQIVIAHQVIPSLFGIQTAGSLGNKNELDNGYEIFMSKYVKGKQKNVLEFYNYILNINGLPSALTINNIKPNFI